MSVKDNRVEQSVSTFCARFTARFPKIFVCEPTTAAIAATDFAPAGPMPLSPTLSDASLVSFLLCTASQMAVIPLSLIELSTN